MTIKTKTKSYLNPLNGKVNILTKMVDFGIF